jgi:hypothetical protein
MTRNSLVVLTDTYIQSHLLVSGQILQEFPFLMPAKKAVDALSGCGGCQRANKKNAANRAINEAKRAIAMLPDDRKARLKELLGASEVRLQWRVEIGDRAERDRVQF